MTIFRIILKYIIDPTFRKYMIYFMARVENKNGIQDKIDEEVQKFKQETAEMLKKRVDKLQSAINVLKPVPQASVVVSPLNDLLNELKQDFKEISEMINE
jgi:predicted transcriptional regulator